MKARVLKDISPIIKKDDILIKKGDNYILEGYDKPKKIHNHQWNEEKKDYDRYLTPNYYHKDLVEYSKAWFELFATPFPKSKPKSSPK